MTRVLVIAESETSRRRYCEAVRDAGAECCCAAAVRDAEKELRGGRFNGILLDVPTAVTAGSADKPLLHLLESAFPLVRLRLSPKTGEVSALIPGGRPGDGSPLGAFIADRCRRFEARGIRRAERCRLHLNARMWPSPADLSADPVKTSTMDVSPYGCFLFSAEPFEAGANLVFRLGELEDDSPIDGEVIRCVPWGTPMRIPGVGVAFRSVTPAQAKGLSDLFAAGSVTGIVPDLRR